MRCYCKNEAYILASISQMISAWVIALPYHLMTPLFAEIKQVERPGSDVHPSRRLSTIRAYHRIDRERVQSALATIF